jgi:hypothetical protein
MWHSHAERVAGVWQFACEGPTGAHAGCDPACVTTLDDARLRSVLRWMARRSAPALDATRPLGAALVLGQAFSRFGLMSEDEEYAVYRDVCADLLRNDVRTAWKDHPRLGTGFLPRLRADLADLGNIDSLELPPGLPIEAALIDAGPRAVISGTSTVLFTVQTLGLAPAFTFVDRFRFPRHRRDFRAMARTVQRCVPTMPRTLPPVVASG